MRFVAIFFVHVSFLILFDCLTRAQTHTKVRLSKKFSLCSTVSMLTMPLIMFSFLLMSHAYTRGFVSNCFALLSFFFAARILYWHIHTLTRARRRISQWKIIFQKLPDNGIIGSSGTKRLSPFRCVLCAQGGFIQKINVANFWVDLF